MRHSPLNAALALSEINLKGSVMYKSCAYCGRQFSPVNRTQKYCCSSCKNCSHSSARLASKDTQKLLKASGYYATENGKAEVMRGSHDRTLEANGTSREEWLKMWQERCGNFTSKS